jgi:lipoprotein-releasing system ATP-binding protein
MIAVSARDVCKEFPSPNGTVRILRGCDLSVDAGESVAIMGPSGSGKSTLLNILGTLEPPTSGDVCIAGTNPFTLNETRLASFRNEHIGFVFQDHHLLPQCTLLENVLLPTLAGRSVEDGPSRARELLERVGLSHRLDHRPAELSGGERQRTAIARALINQPELILADEPTGNLDRETADSIADVLQEMHQKHNTALVVVTHSQDLADRFHRRFNVVGGELVEA